MASAILFHGATEIVLGAKNKKHIFVLEHSSVSHCTLLPAMYESLFLPVTVI